MEQLLRVILLCEIVSVETDTICSDAGGSNTALFTALRNDRKIEGKVLLDDNLVSFQHPFNPSRRISIITCAVHGQKAFRNNLPKSQDKGVRDFVRKNIRFGWNQLIDLYSEDETDQTKLTKSSIDPDRFSKMNVSDAGAPFHFDTIAFACNRLASLLPNCDDNVFLLDARIKLLGGSESATTEG